MKILFVCKSLPPAVSGGIQTHTWKLTEWLVKMGHEVSILTAGSWKKGTQQFEREGRNIIELAYLPGRKSPIMPLFAEELAFNITATQWLKRNQKDYDIVHIQGRSGFGISSHRGKTPMIATFHGLVSVENERSGRNQNFRFGTWLHEKWATFFEQKTMLRADMCIAVSREMLHAMEENIANIGNKTAILPNGVDTDDAMMSAPRKVSNTLLFVGRLDPIKGVFPLVEAMKLTRPEMHLVMIGDGPSRVALEQSIAEAGLQSRITLLGALPSEQVFAHIKASFALVLPSFHETQGIVLLEANACKVPVVASDIPGIREVVRQGETGWMSPVGNAALMAASINRLFDDPDEAFCMGEAGYHHVKDKFAWEKIAIETERLYGQVLASRNHDLAAIEKEPLVLNRYIAPFLCV